MALAIDSQMGSATGFGVASGSSPQTFTFNNVAGTLIYALLGVAGSGSVGITYGSVTYNSVALTSIIEKNTGTVGNGGKVAVYRLLTPATGTNTLSFAATATGSIIHWFGGCISFTGNDPTTPEVQSGSAASAATPSATAALTLTSVVAGNYTVAVAGAGSSMSAQTQTLTWAKNIANTSSMGNGRASVSTSSGSVTHSYTISASDSWAVAGVEVKAAATGRTPRNPAVNFQNPAFNMQALRGSWRRRLSGIVVPDPRIITV